MSPMQASFEKTSNTAVNLPMARPELAESLENLIYIGFCHHVQCHCEFIVDLVTLLSFTVNSQRIFIADFEGLNWKSRNNFIGHIRGKPEIREKRDMRKNRGYPEIPENHDM